MAKAVVFVASPHSCASDCMLELSRALDLGKAVVPAWRLRTELDPRAAGLLRGLAIADFTTRAPAPRVPHRGVIGLLAHPNARCDPAAGPFCFVWSSPEDAPHAAAAVGAAALRGVRCFVDCSDGPPEEGASRALAACAAFVPLLGASSSSSPALASRLKAAAAHSVPVPFALEYTLARTRGFPLVPRGGAADDVDVDPAVLDALLADIDARGPRPDAAPAAAPVWHDHSAVPGAPSSRDRDREALRAAIAKLDAEHARLEAELVELDPLGCSGGPQAAGSPFFESL
eukprot:tig00000073_g1753.t1